MARLRSCRADVRRSDDQVSALQLQLLVVPGVWHAAEDNTHRRHLQKGLQLFYIITDGDSVAIIIIIIRRRRRRRRRRRSNLMFYAQSTIAVISRRRRRRMYIYHALINALSAHMIHINLTIFNTHVERSPTNNNNI